MARNEAQLESEELMRAERDMTISRMALTARYHGIDLVLAPRYNVFLEPGGQEIGQVWKEGAAKFYGVPTNHPDRFDIEEEF